MAKTRRKNTNGNMSKTEYKKALDKLGLSIVGGSRLGLSRRQSQRIAAGHAPVPAPLANLLKLMVKKKISVDDLEDRERK